jgi:hypothetical protein
MEEISEQILYYHRDRRIGITTAEDDERNLTLGTGNLLEETVQFLGLCTALFTLPTSLNVAVTSDSDLENDRTKAVYFGNSTLVFIPLEASLDIVGIVQVARSYQNGKSDTGSANPLAMRASIERCHLLFCMLRGGILSRLRAASSYNEKASVSDRNDSKRPNPCPYEEMNDLFSLLKEIRKCKQQSALSTSDAANEELSSKIDSLQDEVRRLRQRLPIQSIRRDLDAHYKEYLSEFSLVVSRNGGAGRCLVEMMPIPVAQDSGSHTFQMPPDSLTLEMAESLGQSVRQILESCSPKLSNENDVTLLGRSLHHGLQSRPEGNFEPNGASLVGISLFRGGQLLNSYAFSEKFRISRQSASLLMAYMASYRTKINSVASTRHRIAGRSTPATRDVGLSRLTLSFGSTTDEPQKFMLESYDGSPANLPDREIDLRRGRFMPSPPQFMLSSSSDPTYSIVSSEEGQDIWAPAVHLALDSATLDGEAIANDDKILEANMVLLEFPHFSYLLFLSIPISTSASSESAELLLMKLKKELSDATLRALQREREDPNDLVAAPPPLKSESGQDVVLVERRKHKLVLFLDLKISSSLSRWDARKEPLSLTTARTRRFLGFAPKKDKIDSNSSKQGRANSTSEWSALGLDCRHLLASRLPLDVCLAFDDMVNEVTERRQAQHCNEGPASFVGNDECTSYLELCTCVPHGWIYAFGKGDKELYAFFDSSIYVTVADVQSAALNIQEHIMVA